MYTSSDDYEKFIPCCGKCKGGLQRVVGMPSEYPSHASVYCDKCRADHIERHEYLYHCKPCGYDVYKNCVAKEEAKWKEKKIANSFKFDQPDETEKEKMTKE